MQITVKDREVDNYLDLGWVIEEILVFQNGIRLWKLKSDKVLTM